MSDIILFDFLPIKTAFLILHVFGVIMAFGAAMMTDAMFFTSIKKKMLTAVDLKFIKLGSSVVWVGLSIILISGVLLYFVNPDLYANSDKFWAKMTIVGILVINGLIFHFVHLPVLVRNKDTFLPSSPEFIKKSHLLYLSGAISSTSWMIVFILGMIKANPFTYGATMAVYGLILVVAAIGAVIARKMLLKAKPDEDPTLKSF